MPFGYGSPREQMPVGRKGREGSVCVTFIFPLPGLSFTSPWLIQSKVWLWLTLCLTLIAEEYELHFIFWRAYEQSKCISPFSGGCEVQDQTNLASGKSLLSSSETAIFSLCPHLETMGREHSEVSVTGQESHSWRLPPHDRIISEASLPNSRALGMGFILWIWEERTQTTHSKDSLRRSHRQP